MENYCYVWNYYTMKFGYIDRTQINIASLLNPILVLHELPRKQVLKMFLRSVNQNI